MNNPNVCGFDTVLPVDNPPPRATPGWQRFPGVPLALTLLFFAFLLLPTVRENPRLWWTFVGVGAGLSTWITILWIGAKRWTQCFRIELVPLVKQHYIQAAVQSTLYAYWGWYFRDVYAEVPLILSQLVFVYVFDALLSWSRGRSWRLGCGLLPIILSTNVFLWFKNDWYYFQFLLIATAVLGKEFLKWNREGKRTHIFNPSAFALGLFALVLILTGTTDHTWAGRIADSFAKPPQIYVVIFMLGLVVQYFFSVTLMTLSAAATLCVLGVVYTWSTGTYYFVFWNLPAPVFLGLHLLVTDPSTSPRTNTGKVIFGSLYGLLAFALYGLLAHFDSYTVYDKLLPIPLLNLSVQGIDRLARSDFFARFNRWEAQFQPRRLNLVHMAGWSVMFLSLLGAGFVQAPHEGATYAFWKKALDEGRPGAAKGLLEVVKSQARDGSSAAWNELGMFYLEGQIVKKDVPTAARYFAQSSKLGNVAGSANLVTQFLASNSAKNSKVVTTAFDQLEAACDQGADGAICSLLGIAYETGKGRPQDLARAREYYKQGCIRGHKGCCNGLSRMPFKSTTSNAQPPPALR